jgi:hypothetical protein
MDQILKITGIAFIRHWKHNERTLRQFISYSYALRKVMVLCGGNYFSTILTGVGAHGKIFRFTYLHKTYSKIHRGKHKSYMFPLQNGLKQDAS